MCAIAQQKVILDNNGLWGNSQKVGLEYILALDPDRLIAPCYIALGKIPKAKQYGGWESRQIAGHSLGHYLSALAGFYANTNNPDIKFKLEYTITELAAIQREDGYLGGVISTPFDNAFSGDFAVDNFSLDGFWVPWYSVHKIYSGLIDAYKIGGDKKVLDIVCKMADWAINGSKNMSEEAFQKMLICEHGGMCEVFADLFEITKRKDYLNMSIRFIQKKIVQPLENKQDKLQGLHANTQIPKLIGLAKLYELTGIESYRTAVTYFFETVINHRSFVIGGNSVSEHFGPIDTETLADDACETCNTYNMLKLAEFLFSWTKKPEYADFYEKALINDILASQDPDSGAKTYFIATTPGHFKVYGTKEDSFWCCTGTGMENPERYNQFIWTRESDNLYLNLFISNTIELLDKNIVFQVSTEFPYSNKLIIKALKANNSAITLHIRVPGWLETPMTLNHNNKETKLIGSSYFPITRTWNTGDLFELDIPQSLRMHVAPDDPHKVALLYGPVVLAAKLGMQDFPLTDIVPDHLSLMGWKKIKVPNLITDSTNPKDWIHPIDLNHLMFQTDAVGQPGSVKLTLVPFFAIQHERYAFYFKHYSSQEWSLGVAVTRTRDEIYEDTTIDVVKVGQQQSEIEHHMASKNSFSGYISSIDMQWRDARGADAYIEYVMKVNPKKKNNLLIGLFDKDGPMGDDKRTYSILVENQVVKQIDWIGSGTDACIDQIIPLEKNLFSNIEPGLDGLINLHIRFLSLGDHSIVGGILEVRILNQ